MNCGQVHYADTAAGASINVASDVANAMACSVIGFRLDYCNSLLVGISEQNLDSIQRVQSKTARIHRVSKNCAFLFLSLLRQTSTNFNKFW